MDAIIPAAGQAKRMRGIPKFLLPGDAAYRTLIERHIDNLASLVDTIWIPIRPEFVFLLESLNLPRQQVVIIPLASDTMTESVGRILQISSSESFYMVMPDTVYVGEQPYEKLLDPDFITLACWEIRQNQKGKLGQVQIEGNFATSIRDKDANCEFPQSWGAMSFTRRISDYIDYSDSHIGFAAQKAVEAGEAVRAFRVNGAYFDCGTPHEYAEMVKLSFDVNSSS